MKFTKVSQILKKDYVKTIVLAIILFVGVFAFWFGLRFAFQSDFPLLAVASESMEDLLFRGDLIVVQGGLNYAELNAAPKDAQSPGEVIVYYDPRYGRDSNRLIVHRAIEKYQNEDGTWYFTTAGDKYGTRDSWSPFSQEQIVGKVIGKVPWVGHVPLFMHENPVLATLIIGLLFMVMIVMDFILPLKREKENQNQEEKLLNIYRG